MAMPYEEISGSDISPIGCKSTSDSSSGNVGGNKSGNASISVSGAGPDVSLRLATSSLGLKKWNGIPSKNNKSPSSRSDSVSLLSADGRSNAPTGSDTRFFARPPVFLLNSSPLEFLLRVPLPWSKLKSWSSSSSRQRFFPVPLILHRTMWCTIERSPRMKYGWE